MCLIQTMLWTVEKMNHYLCTGLSYSNKFCELLFKDNPSHLPAGVAFSSNIIMNLAWNGPLFVYWCLWFKQCYDLWINWIESFTCWSIYFFISFTLFKQCYELLMKWTKSAVCVCLSLYAVDQITQFNILLIFSHECIELCSQWTCNCILKHELPLRESLGKEHVFGIFKPF